MATRACPRCGSQYVASVRRCIDCDVSLVDEIGPEGDEVVAESTPVGEGDQIAYELAGWGSQLKVTLEGMLDRAGVPRVWEAGALVVPAGQESQVDELIATVEGAEAVDLDDDVDQVAFEIEDLSDDELLELDARLIAEHLPHAWEETGALLVAASDEAAAAQVIEALLTEAVATGGDDGLATHEALDAVFVAVDKLMKDPTDDRLADRYRTAAAGVEGCDVPYGMAGAEWAGLLDDVAELRELVDGAAQAEQGVDPEEEGAEPPMSPREQAADAARRLRHRLAELV